MHPFYYDFSSSFSHKYTKSISSQIAAVRLNPSGNLRFDLEQAFESNSERNLIFGLSDAPQALSRVLLKLFILFYTDYSGSACRRLGTKLKNVMHEWASWCRGGGGATWSDERSFESRHIRSAFNLGGNLSKWLVLKYETCIYNWIVIIRKYTWYLEYLLPEISRDTSPFVRDCQSKVIAVYHKKNVKMRLKIT